MNFLLDTNVISEIRKGRRTHPQVSHWWASTHASQIYLSVLTLGELRIGIEKIRVKDQRQAMHLKVWFDRLILVFADRLLPVDQQTAEIWAEIGVDRTLPVIDSLLAATAIARNLVFVTRNIRDISDCGVRLLNPFEA